MVLLIQEVTLDKREICESILRLLPRWFGIEESIQSYLSDIEQMPTYLAMANQVPVGFLTLKIHNNYTAEIQIMAVLEKYHRKKIGSKLIHFAETLLQNRGYEFLTVKTLGASRNNSEYEKTRRFYLSLGFRPVEEFKNLWGENLPCLLLIKSLQKSQI